MIHITSDDNCLWYILSTVISIIIHILLGCMILLLNSLMYPLSDAMRNVIFVLQNLLLKASPEGWIIKIVDFGLSNTHEVRYLNCTALHCTVVTSAPYLILPCFAARIDALHDCYVCDMIQGMVCIIL